MIAAIVAASGALGYSSYKRNQKPALSELAMENVSALTAGGEGSGSSGGTAGVVDHTGGLANKYCPIWNVTYKPVLPFPEITCNTGGAYKCENGTCPHGSK